MEERKITGETVWQEGTRTLDRLVIEEGASLKAPEGKSLMLEAEGALWDPRPGTWEGPVTVHVLEAMETWGEMKGPYRSGVFFGPAGLEKAKSALGDRLEEGETRLRDLDLTLRGNFLNGLSVDSGRVTVEDSTIRFFGNGDDFRMTGTAVAAGGDSDLTLRNCRLVSRGVAATTLAVGGAADVLLDRCTLEGRGTEDPDYYLTDHHLTVVPWVLGLRGTVRAANLLERGTVTYYDCAASCNGWGSCPWT